MKILLIVPAAANLRVNSKAQKVLKRSMLRFSVMPITAVAAATPKGHEVLLCDENVEPIDFDTDADLIGLSLMTATSTRGYEIAAAFRAKGKTVVAGGYHATLCPEFVAPNVDAVVKGDAEATWPALLRDIENGCLKPEYCSRGTFDLSKMSSPRRDLTIKNKKHYVTLNAVQVGRGCKHACKYCSITAFHKQTYRVRPIEAVFKELKQLPKNVIFVDDNIIADPEYALTLFKAIAPLKKRWVTQCSLQIADDPELLKWARKAGCRGLFVGVETISEENLQNVDKSFNQTSKYTTRIKAIREAGIGVIAGMIVGMDKDDVHVFEQTLKFLQRTSMDALQLNIMTPLPGTPLFKKMDDENRIIDKDWSHYDFRHAVIQPRRMTPRELQAGADWLYRQFYRLDRIVIRTLKALLTSGLVPAYLCWRLNMTYRYDNKRENIVGWNPAHTPHSRLSRPLLHSTRRVEAFPPIGIE